ncbi:MAG TPA: NINE protein [Oxalicibacterium sp.]|nr:NINE protein [Oxalicibacterium sp.]
MSDMIYCQGCGKEIHKTANACPHCGASHYTKRYKDKTVAGLLAIFLGGFGAHRFYLGKWWGVLYLLFFWLWVPGIIALIEGIVFLCTDDRKWDDKHNDGCRYGSRSGAGVAIAIVAGALVGVAFIGILAAIAIPAYQDYTNKAKIAQAYHEANEAAIQVASYAAQTRSVPNTLQEAGYGKALPAYVRSMDVDSRTAVIRVTMAAGSLNGKSFLLRPTVQSDANIQWQCISEDIEARLLPQKCR